MVQRFCVDRRMGLRFGCDWIVLSDAGARLYADYPNHKVVTFYAALWPTFTLPLTQAVVAQKEVFIAELKELIEKPEGQVQDYRRTKFGPKSEKLDPAQLELALEDLETAIAETQAQIEAVEERLTASETDPEKKAPRKTRKARALPQSLPRVERVVEPESIACPCGCGDMVKPPFHGVQANHYRAMGEDRSERLDYIAAIDQVIHWPEVHCAAT